MNRVQEIRKERNITQVQLAKYAGISRKYLSNVENQLANPSVDVAFRISTALSVDIDKIFFDVPKSNITVYPKPLRYIDLFCGIGGFRYASKGAFDKLGINGKCVFSSDIDKYAQQAYEANFGEKPVGDITKVDAESIPDFDLLFGGFPCQGFSVANTKRHEDDERNVLYKQLIRMIDAKRPKFFLAENVKGITNLAKGKVFQMILKDFTELGYKVKHKILNAADYVVPQTRQRVIIIGVRNDINFEYIYPLPTNSKNGKDGLPEWISVSEAMAHIPDPDLPNDLPNHVYSKYKLNFNGYLGHRPLDPDKPAPTVTARGDNKGGVVILPHPNGKRRKTQSVGCGNQSD